MKTLAEQFQASLGQPVEIGGRSIKPVYSKTISKTTSVSLHWVGTRSSVKQGVQIKLEKGTMDINGQVLSNIVLWEDTCPPVIFFRCTPTKSAKLKIWNVWEVDDLVQAWVGNSGMDISRDNDKVVLNCSDGIGDISFNNMTLEIHLSN